MMSIFINLTEEQLELRSEPTIVDQMVFWKKRSYQIEIPIKKIERIEVKMGFAVRTAFVSIFDQDEVLEFSLQRANKNDLEIISHFTEPFEISNYIQVSKYISRHGLRIPKMSDWGGVRLASA